MDDTYNINTKGSVGIALAHNRVSAAHVLHDDDEIPVLRWCDTAAYESEQQLIEVLTRWADEQGLKDQPTTYVMPQEAYQLFLVEAPDVSPSELGDAVRWRCKDLIDFSIEEAVVDAFLVPGSQEEERAKMAYAVIAKQAELDNTVEWVEDAGYKLQHVDIREFALRNVAILSPFSQDSYVLLHWHDDDVKLLLGYLDDMYLTRHMSFKNQATDLADLVMEVHRSCDYAQTELGQPPVSNMLINPLPDGRSSLMDALVEKLDYKVDMLDFNQFLRCQSPCSVAMQNAVFEAVGGALRVQSHATD